MASKNVPAEKGADIPGPGSYEPYRTGLNKQSVKIGHEKRLFTYNTDIPGPGCTSWNYSAYNVSRPFSAGANGPKAVFTREDRMKLTGVDINQLGRIEGVNSSWSVQLPIGLRQDRREGLQHQWEIRNEEHRGRSRPRRLQPTINR